MLMASMLAAPSVMRAGGRVIAIIILGSGRYRRSRAARIRCKVDSLVLLARYLQLARLWRPMIGCAAARRCSPAIFRARSDARRGLPSLHIRPHFSRPARAAFARARLEPPHRVTDFCVRCRRSRAAFQYSPLQLAAARSASRRFSRFQDDMMRPFS